jgi:hypothetical protein
MVVRPESVHHPPAAVIETASISGESSFRLQAPSIFAITQFVDN